MPQAFETALEMKVTPVHLKLSLFSSALLFFWGGGLFSSLPNPPIQRKLHPQLNPLVWKARRWIFFCVDPEGWFHRILLTLYLEKMKIFPVHVQPSVCEPEVLPKHYLELLSRVSKIPH